ncbi:hypothetical protein [Blastococcus tunisiensis]|uniref:Gram-positive cocci surface proteins LPxTG domain-containing protein n=1 Tax=Blastococcus tunisiensis TaxID=1798228 RepID=A0A1I2FFB2_9ACTN|nr:hypothetical protein [Blastococcus sp. DSM 46838]SFF04194.1 hypothetical protein SAMN05216574_10896 [Blastococcus sp. DSM 46838]
MNRSVRNGLAIAGMAGGMLFLGQAVASADTDAAASGEITSTTAGHGSGDATSVNGQKVAAGNDVENDASTGDVDAGGGTSAVGVVAGNGNTVHAASGAGDVDASQKVATEVTVASQANGGTVTGSNNAAAGNGATNEATATGTIDSTTTGGAGYGGDATSVNGQVVGAGNDVDNEAETGDIDAGGGTSAVGVIAGNGNSVVAHSYKGDVDASQHVDTTVDVASAANGGHVAGSNNAAAGNGAHNTADAKGSIDSTTTGGSGRHSDSDSANYQHVGAENAVENEAETGDVDASGGESIVVVEAGNGNTLYCSSVKGDVTCHQNINVIINIISEANGGTVTCTNNAAAGNAAEWKCELPKAPAPAPAPPAKPVVQPEKDCPEEAKPAYTAKPAAPAAAKPVAYRPAAMNTYAQPTGQLAYTGAETTAPLALGLIALGAGGALTLAGRRRTSATV